MENFRNIEFVKNSVLTNITSQSIFSIREAMLRKILLHLHRRIGKRDFFEINIRLFKVQTENW